MPRKTKKTNPAATTFTHDEARKLARLVAYVSQLTLPKYRWWLNQWIGYDHSYFDSYERNRVERVRFIEDSIFRMDAKQYDAAWAAIMRIGSEPREVEREIRELDRAHRPALAAG